QWRSLLLRSGAIQARNTWPAEEPFAIGMRVPSWLPWGPRPYEILAIPRHTPQVCAKAGDLFDPSSPVVGADERLDRERYQRLGVLSADTKSVVLDVEIHRPGRKDAGMGDGFEVNDFDHLDIVWRGEVRLPVRVVPHMDQVVQPVAQTTADIRAAIS